MVLTPSITQATLPIFLSLRRDTGNSRWTGRLLAFVYTNFTYFFFVFLFGMFFCILTLHSLSKAMILAGKGTCINFISTVSGNQEKQ